MNSTKSAREIALKALYKVDAEQGYSNLVLDEIFSTEKVNAIDKPLITEIVYGVITRKLTLDYIIGLYSKIKGNKISPWIKNILRIGLYQIFYLSKIPVSAACNESVKLARRYGHQASAGFVNAVLRKAANSPIDYNQFNGADNVKRISIIYSHPEWIVKRWIDEFGKDFTEELCKANNEKPHIAIRVNTLKTNIIKLTDLLNSKGIEFIESNFLDLALILRQGNPINELYESGMYTVQDEAAMLVSEILDPKPEDIVADVCSAPGGKTTHIAQLMENQGKIFAYDIHPHRVELVKKAAERLNVKIIESKVHDATQLIDNLIEKCDKVLVDAPCSGLGVIRRKPEIKWSRKEEDLNELSKLQKKILNISSKYVKSGGRIVYSTCTLNRGENEDIVYDFLKNNKNFTLESCNIKSYDIDSINRKTQYIHLYPNIHKTDGFFIASMKKT